MRWILLSLCTVLIVLLGSGCSTSVGGSSNDTGGNQDGNVTLGGWAGTLADAGATHPQGAVLVPWNSLGGRVIAYFVYRDNNTSVPIDVKPAGINYIIDSTNILPGGNAAATTKLTVNIDAKTGLITQYNSVPGYEATAGTTSNVQLTDDAFSITCRRKPLVPGQPVRYRIATLYIGANPNAIDDPLGLSDQYRLFFSNPGPASTAISPLPVPQLEAPVTGSAPINGLFSAQTVLPRYLQYVLQLSADDSTFAATHTVNVTPAVTGTLVQASYTTGQMANNAVLKGARYIYWRIGVRASGEPLPVAEWDATRTGWVFSEVRTFALTTPPNPPGN